MFFATFDRCRIAVPCTAISDGSEVRAYSTDIRVETGPVGLPTDGTRKRSDGILAPKLVSRSFYPLMSVAYPLQ